MSSTTSLLSALETFTAAQQGFVIATVVKTQGSAYRQVGAHMLIDASGNSWGTISGGCLEAELRKKAWWFTEQRSVLLRSYTTGNEDDEIEDITHGYGLGCNGQLWILLERVSHNTHHPLLDLLRQADETQQTISLLQIIDGPSALVGQRLILNQQHQITDGDIDSSLAPGLNMHIQHMMADKAFLSAYQDDVLGELTLALSVIKPRPRIVIFGAGHDAQPLVQFAAALDWRVVVYDSRPQLAKAERFPEAEYVECNPLSLTDRQKQSLDGAYVVIMTHSYTQDIYWLQTALKQQPHYIGQLGPRYRTEKLLNEFVLPAHNAMSVLHYPIGLDIGADTPETVALAILAELQACIKHRSGGQLKFRQTSIHAK